MGLFGCGLLLFRIFGCCLLLSAVDDTELRSYHNSCLRKNGLVSELVDVLAGRVPKSVFCRHYLGEDIKAFGATVLRIEDNLEKTLLS